MKRENLCVAGRIVVRGFTAGQKERSYETCDPGVLFFVAYGTAGLSVSPAFSSTT